MPGKLKVLCARSMTVAVNALADDFTRATGEDLDITFGTVGALQAKLAAGETADVVILGAPAIVKMEQAGTVVAGSRADIAKTSIGVCVREGTTPPDISTPEAFKQALLAARVIAMSDPAVGGTAGVYLVGLWQRMGIAEEIRKKSSPQKSGAEVAQRVVEGEADLGLTLIGEIASVKSARVIGKLPPPYGQDTTYAAAAITGANARAKDFITALAHSSTKTVWSAAGFEWAGKGS
jgi:molybdate transport system substrate-binding protein